MYTENDLQAAFHSGMNKSIPENIQEQGPIGCYCYMINEYKFWFESRYQTKSELQANLD